MVRPLLVLLLALLPLAGFTSPSLELQVDQDTQQLGRAFPARLIASGIDANLSHIDLSPLETDFGVVIREYLGSTGNANNTAQQQLALQLYPRRTGHLQVPALAFAAASSNPLDLEVLQAQGASGPINVEYHITSAQPWQRQQVLLRISVTTPDKFARLDAMEMLHKDSEVRTMAASKVTQGGSTRLETGWVIFPLQSGRQRISLPPVLYHLQGAVERRFYLPHVELNVRPLPDYIPPLMPVGRVSVDSSIEANKLLNTGETYHWNIRLHSPELLPHLLPPVLRQISPDKQVNYLPARSRREENITALGSHGVVVHTIPFQSLSTGRIKLPELRIQYFDPEQGRVSTIRHRPPQIWSMAGYWQVLIATGFLLAGIFMVKAAWKYGLCLRRKNAYMREAIHHIGQAATGLQLRQTLRLIARAQQWPENLSITKWSEYWNSHYSPSATATVEMLSRACYARSKTDPLQIRDNLLKLINDRKPRHRRCGVNCD